MFVLFRHVLAISFVDAVFPELLTVLAKARVRLVVLCNALLTERHVQEEATEKTINMPDVQTLSRPAFRALCSLLFSHSIVQNQFTHTHSPPYSRTIGLGAAVVPNFRVCFGI